MSLKGIVLSVLLGVFALIIAPYIPILNAIILALLLGIIISNVFTLPSGFDSGISFSSKYLLEIAIIFLGFGISFQDIANLGWQLAVILILTIIIVLFATIYLAKLFTCRTSTGYLVGFGTAICGSSAIAALAPKISENKKDAGIAIAVVNLLGLVGMIALPLIFSEKMIAEKIALIIGGSLHGVSNVAGAGYAINEHIGDLAITIKLGRVALLAPAMIFFNFIINKDASIRSNLKLPYYIVGFILASTLVTFISLPSDLLSSFRWIGNALLTISMAAIGLNIHFKHLYKEGKVALGFGAVIFLIMIAIIMLLYYLLYQF